ncbi:sugar MFS transporter [Prevotella sp. E13-17]|uniref:sugar MFS transporter n=1 Tax=Prevotella sp. E13-17 TaxID=2913616 RepID=UPI001EDAB7C1|nr:sugar MFS transporter [Prevotella sp. E13-17]UKK51637.1 sugar MFS transporter [Prevotella sp. E13-17]
MKKERITYSRYLTPFILVTLLFFLWGFARAILDVLNKHFQDEMAISITRSAWIQVTTYLGYFLMAIPAGMFIRRYGYRNGVVLGLSIFGLGALAFIPISSFYGFLIALFIIGCGLTFLETAANPYVTELGPKRTSASRLNLSQTFNGMGCFMATLLVGQFLYRESAKGADVAVPYGILGTVVLIIAVLFSRVRLPEIKHDQHDNQGLTSVLNNRWFLFGFLALLCYEIAEISINSYFMNFVTDTGWMSKLMASRLVSFALIIFMCGRFIGSWVMSAVKAEKMLFFCAFGSVICMTLTFLDLGVLSLFALVLNYLFEAIMFPTIFSLAIRGLGSQTKSASSLLMMTPIGGCGFLLMGYLADHTTPYIPFILPLTAFLVVLVYAALMVRKSSV